jgi:hypothetical protein
MTFDPTAMSADPFKLGLLAALDDPEVARASAIKLAPHLPSAEPAVPDAWLNARGAAEYLGLTLHALHKLTAARRIPFEQDCPNGKLWFKRSKLDGWRRDGHCGRFHSASTVKKNRR